MKYTHLYLVVLGFLLYIGTAFENQPDIQQSFEPVIDLPSDITSTSQEQAWDMNQRNPETQNPGKQAKSTWRSPSEMLARIPSALTYENLVYHRYEVMCLGLILLYMLHYNWGKSKNAAIVQAFYKSTHGFFNEQFAHIGFSKENGEDPFIAQSAHQILFYASGRDNVDSLQMNLSLKKRQDILYHYFYQLIYPDRDLITIDIPVKSNVMAVFCLANKRGLKALSDNSFDLRQLTSSFDLKTLNSHFQILGESGDIIDQVFDQNTIKKINSLQGLLVSIHYTDQKMFSESTGHLRAVLNASHSNKELYPVAFEMLLNIADKMVTLKLSNNAKQTAIKSREVLNASKEKEEMERHREELRKKKEDKLRKEESRLRSLPPEKQKRQDQKRKKKQMGKMVKGKAIKAT